MKKVDVKFLLVQVLIIAVLSVVVGIGVSIALSGEDKENMIIGGIRLAPIFFFILGFWYMAFSNTFTGIIAKKTMKVNAEKENFENSSTFITAGSFTLGAIVKIDEATGRVAYVSYQNPKEFQMVHAKELTKIESSYKKAPLGGTSYVYFQFYYKNKKVRIPTFTASNVYSLKSKEVLEGISKADAFCDLLKNAQQVGA